MITSFCGAVRNRIHVNRESDVGSRLERSRLSVVEGARLGVITSERGFRIRWERLAHEEIVRVAESVEPRRVVEMVLAMYHCARHEPGRFRSNRTFLLQMTRRVRYLTVTPRHFPSAVGGMPEGRWSS